MSKQIPLTQGKFTTVDDDDYEVLKNYKWCAQRYSTHFYAVYNYKCGERMIMHRFIMKANKRYVVDHINGDTLDNTKSNLRVCSRLHNAQNRKAQSNNTSGYKGVSWDDKSNKWRATITSNYKKYYLGDYTCLIKAVKAYNAAAIKHHGKFAKLNKIWG